MNVFNSSEWVFRLCLPSTLDSTKVSGKIVLCLRGTVSAYDKSMEVQAAGGLGVIIYNSPSFYDYDLASTTFPTIGVYRSDGLLIKNYIAKNR